eukprot:scaffold843_cov255-Pinguiococcus_pyrenoidosus.AAC.15
MESARSAVALPPPAVSSACRLCMSFLARLSPSAGNLQRRTCAAGSAGQSGSRELPWGAAGVRCGFASRRGAHQARI